MKNNSKRKAVISSPFVNVFDNLDLGIGKTEVILSSSNPGKSLYLASVDYQEFIPILKNHEEEAEDRLRKKMNKTFNESKSLYIPSKQLKK